MVRFLRKWLHFVMSIMMLSYMCLCTYILVVTQTSPPVAEILQLTGKDLEQNSSKNWHFEEHGHQHFHAEQNRLKKEKDERMKQELAKNNPSTPAPLLFQNWRKQHKSMASCDIDIFDLKVILLHNVVLNRKLAYARAKGGEEIQDVINRNDDDETYVVRTGYFAVPYKKNMSSKCSVSLVGSPPHFKIWSKAVRAYHPSRLNQTQHDREKLTILTTRYEYANVFWTVVELYNTFLTVTFLNETMNNTHLLIVDGHPSTPLDRLWYGIFKNVSRPHQLPPLSTYRTMAWTFAREFSPMLSENADLPLIHEFRDVVLQSFHIPLRHRPACPSLNVTLVWRRNYVAHPRNPEGIIARKISNENELVSAVRGQFPGYNVTDVQLDLLPMSQQLQLLAHTDIFVGMHGAAFGFSVLLPPTSAVLELFPYGHGGNWHMANLAEKSGHLYYMWKNRDKKREDIVNKYTNVPPMDVIKLITSASEHICSGNKSNKSVKKSVTRPIALKPVKINKVF